MSDPFSDLPAFERPARPASAPSDNARYVAAGDDDAPTGNDVAASSATPLPPPPPPPDGDEVREIPQGGGGPATAATSRRGAPRSRATSPESGLASATPCTRDEPVASLLPPPIIEERSMQVQADADREAGLPVGPEPGDDRATLALKGRLARMHLAASGDGMHDRALATLDAIASGEVRAKHVTKDGDVVEVDLHPRFRSSAAKAILASAQAAAKVAGSKVNIENAQIVNAGDLIATVDPVKLREARDRLRRG